jgi:hypothetical protein
VHSGNAPAFAFSILRRSKCKSGGPPMRKPLSSKDRGAHPSGSRRTDWMILHASLMTGMVLRCPNLASAQTSLPPNMPSSLGVGATSPFNSPFGPRAGLPLGPTEIATSGMPSQNRGTENCAGPSNARSPGGLFDGGGLSGVFGSTSLSCADSRPLQSFPPVLSPVGRVRIPLGAPELGNAGVSAVLTTHGANQPGPAMTAPLGGTPPTSSTGNP